MGFDAALEEKFCWFTIDRRDASLWAMEETSVLSQNLRRIRVAKKLSQAELAARVSLSRFAYRKIESGVASPDVKTLLRIAGTLEVTLQELLTPVRSLKAVRFCGGLT